MKNIIKYDTNKLLQLKPILECSTYIQTAHACMCVSMCTVIQLLQNPLT